MMQPARADDLKLLSQPAWLARVMSDTAARLKLNSVLLRLSLFKSLLGSFSVHTPEGVSFHHLPKMEDARSPCLLFPNIKKPASQE
jgi:hypothetical protein